MFNHSAQIPRVVFTPKEIIDILLFARSITLGYTINQNNSN